MGLFGKAKEPPKPQWMQNVDVATAVDGRSGIAGRPVNEVAFEFICENPKCRAPNKIEAAVFKAAIKEDTEKRKGKGTPNVGVECCNPKCKKLHKLEAPPGMLMG